MIHMFKIRYFPLNKIRLSKIKIKIEFVLIFFLYLPKRKQLYILGVKTKEKQINIIQS